MYLLIVFLPLLGSSVAGFFGRFLGSEGTAIITGKFLILFALVLFGFIFLCRFYSCRLQDKYGFPFIVLLSVLLFLGVSFLGSLIRIYVFSHVGLDLTALFPIVLSVGTVQGLPEQSPPDPSNESSWSGSWIEKWMNPEVGSSAPNQGGQPREDEASSQPIGGAGPSNAGPSAQDPGEDAGPSSIRRRVDSGPDSGSGPQYLNVSSDTEGRAAPEQRPPEQPPAQPLELEQLQRPTLEEFRQLLENHRRISDAIPKIFQDLHMRVPAGFQSERLTEMLEERHGGRSLGGILRSLQEEGHNSPLFREVQTDFQALRDSGGTEATLRKEWQGRS